MRVIRVHTDAKADEKMRAAAPQMARALANILPMLMLAWPPEAPGSTVHVARAEIVDALRAAGFSVVP